MIRLERMFNTMDDDEIMGLIGSLNESQKDELIDWLLDLRQSREHAEPHQDSDPEED